GRVGRACSEDVGAPLPPPATTTAFTHRERGAPLEVDGTAASYWAAGRLVGFANFAGLPTLVVPAGRADDGLPAGVQIAGPPWSELRLLEIAHALEQAEILPGFTAPPAA